MKEKKWLVTPANSKDVSVNKASDLVWKHKKTVDIQGEEVRMNRKICLGGCRRSHEIKFNSADVAG